MEACISVVNSNSVQGILATKVGGLDVCILLEEGLQRQALCESLLTRGYFPAIIPDYCSGFL